MFISEGGREEERERERQCVNGEEQRERQTQSLKQAPGSELVSTEPNMGLKPMDCEIMT